VNWDRIESNWQQHRGDVKQQWGKLTDVQLDSVAGNREQLADQIQKAYGITRKEAGKQLYDWQKLQTHVSAPKV
jgi:uncharacterized protein YjbJ (UPF0337 family)